MNVFVLLRRDFCMESPAHTELFTLSFLLFCPPVSLNGAGAERLAELSPTAEWGGDTEQHLLMCFESARGC